MKKNFEKFNNADTHLVIADYPEITKKYNRNWGISWYAKRLTDSISQNYNVKFVVLAEKGKNNRPNIYNGNVLVLRVFDQKHYSLFPTILKWLLAFNQIKNVDVHSEFCATGGIRNFILLLPFLFIIHISGKKITYFAHNVVTELNSLAPHLGLNKKSLFIRYLNFGLKYYYNLLGIIANRFVVMDEVIYKRLSKFVNPQKITIHPFWTINPPLKPSRRKARSSLSIRKNDFVLLYFGFISYYKGADWIIKAVKNIRSKNEFKNISLILAGGEAYSLKDKFHYQTFYRSLLSLVKNDKHIRITGFVPEKDIHLYFRAADGVVLPYRGIIGASGSLSHAISYNKPFIISRHMKEFLKNQDIRQILTDNGLSPKDIIFSYNYKSLEQLLNKIRDKKNLRKIRDFSKDLSSKRSIANLIDACYRDLYQPKMIKSSYEVKFLPYLRTEA